jgi:hypothetical protein
MSRISGVVFIVLSCIALYGLGRIDCILFNSYEVI